MEDTAVAYRRGVPAKMGPKTAFYRRYISLLRRQAFRIVGDAGVAERLAHRVMADALGKRQRWTSRRQATALFARVTRLSTQALRRNPPAPGPQRAGLPATHDALRHNLRRFPLGAALVATCTFMADMRPEEVADMLHMATWRVRRRLGLFVDYRSPRATHGCLSGLQASLLACGAVVARPLETQHLEQCRSCRLKLNDEEQAVRLAADEALPQTMRRRSGWRRWLTTFGMGLTLAGCLATATGLWLVGSTSHAAATPPSFAASKALGVTSGDDMAIFVSVLRDGHFIVDDQPLQTLTDLHAGDRLRLRLNDGGNRMVRLDTVQNGHKQRLYHGVINGTVRVPHGIVLANGGTQLRVSVCDTPHGHCANRTYAF